MNSLVLFLNAFLSYFLLFALIVVLVIVAVVCGVKLRHSRDAKKALTQKDQAETADNVES